MISHPDGLILWIKFLVIGPFLYTFAVLFTKCTILCVYLRVFTERPYRIACYIVIVVHILQTIAVCAADVAQCQPLAFLWDKTIEGGKCPVNATELFRWASLPNIVTDIVMLLLPLPYIWKLHASIQIKAALALTLATGSVYVHFQFLLLSKPLDHNIDTGLYSFVISKHETADTVQRGLITSIVRFAIFFDNQVVDDGTWTSVSLISLTIVECSMYLISGCLPIYRPLYVWCRRSLGLSTGETAYNSTGVRSGVSTGGGGGGSSSKATHFSRMHSYHSQRSLENAFEKGDDKYATEFSILEARSDHRPHSSHVGGYSRGEMA